MEVRFKQYSCIAKLGMYGNKRLAIQLIDKHNGEPIATASVNLVHEEVVPENSMFIKDYSENEGMVDALLRANIIEEKALFYSFSGFVTKIPCHKLTEMAITHFGIKNEKVINKQ